MSEDAQAVEGSGEASFDLFSRRAEGTNINPQTLLATDYLNHFNEIGMLLEMIADIPDCLEDAQSWQPKSYPEHFRDSQFHDRDLAVAAYEFVPERYRGPFEEIIIKMNALVAFSIERIASALTDGKNGEELRFICSTAFQTLQKMIDIASAIIHGSERRLDQAEIDGFLTL
jgi:hypothetical protein